MNKQILFSNHSKLKMIDRGTNADEVIKAIYEGSSEPARKGRKLYRKNFPYNKTWRGRKYSLKQVAPVVKEEDDHLMVITVYVYYF